MNRPRIFGLGSHHGDDQAGWLVIDRLIELGYSQSLLHKGAHPADLLDELSPLRPLLVCDACQGTHAPGTVHRWIWPNHSLTELKIGGTHDLPLSQVLEIARHFTESLREVEIWGIEGVDWTPASQPGLSVQTAARHVAAELWSRFYA